MDATAAQFRSVSIRLKEADRSLMLLTRRNIRAAVAPVIPAVRESARSSLPRSGGLNERVAATKIAVGISTSRRSAGVRLKMGQGTGRGRRHMNEINAGSVRHPLYGNREHWYTTPVEPGFFDRPVKAAQPAVAEACMAALRESARIAGFR